MYGILMLLYTVSDKLINARWFHERRVEQDWVADEKSRDVPFIPRADCDVVMIARGKQKFVDVGLRIIIERQPDRA